MSQYFWCFVSIHLIALFQASEVSKFKWNIRFLRISISNPKKRRSKIIKPQYSNSCYHYLIFNKNRIFLLFQCISNHDVEISHRSRSKCGKLRTFTGRCETFLHLMRGVYPSQSTALMSKLEWCPSNTNLRTSRASGV